MLHRDNLADYVWQPILIALEKEPKNIVKVASIEEKKPEEKAVEAVKEVIEAAEQAVKE